MTADMLIKMGLTGELFHTVTGTAFANLRINGQRETWPIRGKRFRWWLRSCRYAATGMAPGAGAITPALDLLEARAQFDGPARAVHVRVAEDAGRIYLDFADDRWRAVEIGPDGRQVVDRPPVRFRRPAGLLPIPIPQRGGSIELLAPYVNLPSRNDFVLVLMWLLAALRACGPYPPLVISGEEGSAKTVLAKILKALVDPNAAPVRALPREDRELFIAANNGHVLAFDNLSGLPSGLSDTLCRLASGGGFAARQLYTDQDEVLFDAARPIILDGIEDFVTRPDLSDRAIFLTLAPQTQAAGRSKNFGEISRSRARASWVRCLMRRRMGCGGCLKYTSSGCRGWLISSCGPRLAKQRCGPPAHSRGPTRRTAAPRSSASSMPIQLQMPCARS